MSLQSLIVGVLNALAPAIKRANATVEVHGPLPTIRGDLTMLAEVFTNVIDNALKFTARAQPMVAVSMRDAGPGLVRIE